MSQCSYRAALEQEGGRAPEWIKLLPWGETQLVDGRRPIILDEDGAKEILAEMARRTTDLVVDYEHQSLSEAVPILAAGWIKELQVREDGLWSRVEWTERARQYIESKEYRYFSPVLQLDTNGRAIGLISVALTNMPAMAEVPPLVAKNQGLGNREQGKTQGEPGMLEIFKKQLGLNGEAGEAEVLRALEQQQEAAGLVQELGQALGLPAPTAAKVKGAVLALKEGRDRLSAVEQELQALKTERQQERARQAVEAAIQVGKVIPAQREWALRYAQSDPEGFAAYVATAPVQVPVAEPPAEQGKPAGTSLSREELALCQAMGLAPEMFKAQREREQTNLRS